jgi:2-iminobutanoate/2-iminopropanoate deaminase
MKLIHSPYTSTPAGHYSHAVETGGMIFVSGVLPGKPAEGEVDSFERQVRASFKHCANILKASDCTLNDVVQCTAYIVGVSNWSEFNTIYADIFGGQKTARARAPRRGKVFCAQKYTRITC